MKFVLCFSVCSNQLASCSWISFCQWWIRWLHDVLGGWVSSVFIVIIHYCIPHLGMFFIFNSYRLGHLALIFMWTSEIIKYHEYRPWDWRGEEKSLIKFSVLSSVFSTSSCTRYKTSKRWKKSLNSVSSNYSIQEMWPKKYFSGLVFPNCSNVAVALLSIMTSQKCHLPLKSL